jgi:protein ImuB
MYGALHSPSAVAEGVLLGLARAFTPRVESLGATDVLLDLHGLGRVWAAPEVLGRALILAGGDRGLPLHAAIASTRVAALVAARGRPGLTVITPGQEADTLAALPLDVLDLAGDRRDLFRRWGLRSLGDLAALPARGLAERLGPDGPRLRRLARGQDDTPLVPTRAPDTFVVALDLEWPIDGLEPLSFVLARVLDPLMTALTRRGRRAAALTLELALVDGGRHRRTLKPAAPSSEARTWRTLLLLDLEAHPPGEAGAWDSGRGQAILAVTVTAEPTAARTVQFSLLDPAQPSPERLAELMARLHEWTSSGRGGAAALLDTHRPGAFAMEAFAPAAASAPGADRQGSPDPRGPRLALRACRPPLPAQVVVRDGAPVFVSAGAAVRGTIVDRAGPWRASGDWWDIPWSREEWDIALDGGGLFRIFNDRLRGAWFVEGELD